MCVVSSLSVEAAPSYPLTVQGEVFSNPEDWVRQALQLCLPKLTIHQARCTCPKKHTEEEKTIRIDHPVLLVSVVFLIYFP